MKKAITHPIIFLTLLILSWGVTGFAQENDNSYLKYKRSHVNRHYEHERYVKVEKKYAALLEKKALDNQEISQYANVLLQLNMADSALTVLALLTESTQLAEEVALNAHLNLGNYDKADSIIQRNPDLKPKNVSNERNITESHQNFPSRENYTLTLEGFNSIESDIAPTICKDTLYFASTRGDKSLIRGTSQLNGSNYQNIYRVEGQQVVAFDEDINSNYNDGPICFSKDGSLMVISRNNYSFSNIGNQKEFYNELQLLLAKKQDNGEWSEPKRLPFCSDSYSCSHPFIKDNRLYFSSDMPGGQGETDIYFVEMDNDGNTIGEVVNLGPEVNGTRREGFPFVDEENTLYFASNSHLGLGGLDIFEAKQKGDKYIVHNMGYKVNTNADDFALIKTDLNNGYLTSNRSGGKGEDDIYSFNITPPYVKVKVINKETLEPISTISYTVSQLPKNDDLKAISDADGYYETMLKHPTVITQAKFSVHDSYNYMPFDSLLEENADDLFIIPLVPRKVGVYGYVYNEKTQERYDDVKISIHKEGELFNELLTADSGAYRQVLDREFDYHMIAVKKGYFPVEVNITTKETTEWVEQNFPMSNMVRLEGIQYKYDKYDITPEAAIKLDHVVEMLMTYPWMNIELSSHTDSRGSDQYNRRLAQNRSNSAVGYIISKGIAKERLVATGHGEDKLLNHCDDGVKCSDEEHQLNRRTEIRIID